MPSDFMTFPIFFSALNFRSRNNFFCALNFGSRKKFFWCTKLWRAQEFVFCVLASAARPPDHQTTRPPVHYIIIRNWTTRPPDHQTTRSKTANFQTQFSLLKMIISLSKFASKIAFGRGELKRKKKRSEVQTTRPPDHQTTRPPDHPFTI